VEKKSRSEVNRGFVALLTLLCLLAFAAYLSTLAPTITWRHWGIDTGELATAAHRLAVPHPSGYPVYLLLGKGFTLLPWGSIAYRTNLLSAFFAAATVGAVAWSIYLSLAATEMRAWPGAIGSLTGAAMFAFSPTFWSQAVITEVYTLHTFLLGLLLLLLVSLPPRPGTDPQISQIVQIGGPSPPRPKTQGVGEELPDGSRRGVTRGGLARLLALAAVSGLALGNHVTSGLALPGGAIFLYLNGTGVLPVQRALWAAPVFLASLSPYLLLVLRSWQGAWPTLWDTSTLPLLWEHVTGGPFKGLLFSFPVDIVLSRLSAAATFTLDQYGVPGVLLATGGLWFMARRTRPLFAFWLLTSGGTVVFALNYPVFDSQVYLLPFYLLLAVALGWGAGFLALFIQEVAPMVPSVAPRLPQGASRLVGLLSLALLVLPVLSYVATRTSVDLSKDWEAYSFAQDTLDTLPSGAVLLSWGGEETFALWYLQHAEDVRPDVMVVDARWSRAANYQRALERRYGDAVPPEGTPDYLQRLIETRPARDAIYATTAAAAMSPEIDPVAEPGRILYRVRRAAGN